ncbi:ABC transporter ATP-binding protein [Treponema brennaborense]|uniref:Polyamine-transporting ATPase n=1 Tax=Treponema brennaborense (strain DSM 12168 / CIP 105900 / DD5/3) TaxID=906968 RepID=F4LM54_TREBD|nr:ABC transporter ATP-binding protein [Treponema brennaborense]AEE16733.1 Polyamine-transporting ATPase [Treponema brennaborense DSM 12168]
MILKEDAADVEISAVTKRYGSVAAVENVSISAAHGSFTTLLGPSGCGKTTLLRMIAGFLEPDSGSVKICGQDQSGIPPEKRAVGMVFQDYALFPHMTVRANLAYGLKVRKIRKDERERRIAETARTLALTNELDRYPHELSGGQQQRVAVGRVIVLKPRILLLDEPLSNLDAKLRNRVRDELKDLQQQLGITTIYVTHDQTEALALSDSIAVMNHGKLEQQGSPADIYTKPATRFTADFIGEANFITDSRGTVCVVRPEQISLTVSEDGDNGEENGSIPTLPETVQAVVTGSYYFGATVRYKLRPLPIHKPLPGGGGIGTQTADSAQTGTGMQDTAGTQTAAALPDRLIADVPCSSVHRFIPTGTVVRVGFTGAAPLS